MAEARRGESLCGLIFAAAAVVREEDESKRKREASSEIEQITNARSNGKRIHSPRSIHGQCYTAVKTFGRPPSEEKERKKERIFAEARHVSLRCFDVRTRFYLWFERGLI